MSRDDFKFMSIMEDSVIKCEDGEVSLPLRNLNLQMPANRSKAICRTLYLKRKFFKDAKFREDCKEDGKVWFILHHGVYHHNKPDKICF